MFVSLFLFLLSLFPLVSCVFSGVSIFVLTYFQFIFVPWVISLLVILGCSPVSCGLCLCIYLVQWFVVVVVMLPLVWCSPFNLIVSVIGFRDGGRRPLPSECGEVYPFTR